jgi:hypothetical protein
MTLKRLWKSALFLLIGSLTCGYLGIFNIIPDQFNPPTFFLFWILCTSLFCISSLLTIQFFGWDKLIDKVLLISFLTFIGFFSSSPIGLMTVCGLPVLAPFFVLFILLLIGSSKKAAES